MGKHGHYPKATLRILEKPKHKKKLKANKTCKVHKGEHVFDIIEEDTPYYREGFRSFVWRCKCGKKGDCCYEGARSEVQTKKEVSWITLWNEYVQNFKKAT